METAGGICDGRAAQSGSEGGVSQTESEMLEAWVNFKNPPEFWDRLSKIELWAEALEELQRRLGKLQPSTAAVHTQDDRSRNPSSKDIARFARHGGPDLSSLRGVS